MHQIFTKLCVYLDNFVFCGFGLNIVFRYLETVFNEKYLFIVNLSAVISFVKWQSEEKVKKANKKLQTTRKHRNVKKVIS